VVPGAGFPGEVGVFLSPVCAVPDLSLGAGVCVEGAAAGVSPPTGVVPGAGWAEGAVVWVFPGAGDVPLGGWVAVGVFAGVVLDGVDCAHSPVVSANANPASDNALELTKSALMT